MPDSAQPKNEDTCEHCGGQLTPIRFGGLCPRCLFSQVITGISANDHPALQPIAITGKCPTIEQLNEELSGFKFHRMIGRGASGWTFLATQISLAREVAVKILPRNLRTNQSVERFRLEAENLAKLNHPRIVTAHDFGSTTNYHFIVMEYVAGQALRTRMQHQTFTAEDAVEVVRQICEATEYAHVKGLLHRDIKPENVLLVGKSLDDGIKVADFGIAKITDQSITQQDLTHTGVTIGTPFYMAPEQSMAGQTDFRADVYSIGVVFYELLTGRLPLGRFRPPSDFGVGSRELDKVVFRSLANSVEDRFQSAKEFLDSLDGVKNAKPNWKPIALVLLSVGLLGAVAAGSISYWSEPVPQLEPVQASTIEHVSSPTESIADTKMAAGDTSKESTSKETEDNPFETHIVADKTPAETIVENPQPEPIDSKSITPDATANQLMLSHVKWSVLPIAEKPVTNKLATNRIVTFPGSLASKPIHSRMSDIVFDRDQTFAIATISNPFEEFSELIAVDVRMGKVRGNYKLPGKKCLPIAVSSDGTRFVTLEQGRGSKTGKISFWSTSDGDLKLNESWLTAPPFDRDGFSLESGMLLNDQQLLTFGKRIILWNVEAARPVYSYPSANKPTFDAHSNRLAFRHGSAIWIIDATEGNVLGTIQCEPDLASLAFSPSGKKLAGCSRAGEVWIWDLADGKIETSANTPNSRAESVEWTGDDHLLVDNQYLIDVRLGVVVWQYERTLNPLYKFSNDRFWIASQSALRPVRLPHKTMKDMTKLKPEQLFVLKTGVSVAIESDLPFDDQECKNIIESLENKLRDIGVSIDASSNLTLVASVLAGEEQSANMSSNDDPFGHRGRTKISFTPHVSTLSLKRGDQTIWERQRIHSVPPTLLPQKDETLQQAADRACKPTTYFFSSCKLPGSLKTLPKEFTVGESSLDQSR